MSMLKILTTQDESCINKAQEKRERIKKRNREINLLNKRRNDPLFNVKESALELKRYLDDK